MLTVGAYLKQKRVKLGLSQRHLARIIGYTSAQYISNVEKDKCYPAKRKIGEWTEAVKGDPHRIIKMMARDYVIKLRAAL